MDTRLNGTIGSIPLADPAVRVHMTDDRTIGRIPLTDPAVVTYTADDPATR